jgi:hypothetical protein
MKSPFEKGEFILLIIKKGITINSRHRQYFNS